MYLTVQARGPEIALRRAIGASRGAVARTFLIEGVTIGVTGGAIGSLTGTVATLLIGHAQGWTALLQPTLVPLALLLGAATGLASSLLPTWSASRQEPANAIRG